MSVALDEPSMKARRCVRSPPYAVLTVYALTMDMEAVNMCRHVNANAMEKELT